MLDHAAARAVALIARLGSFDQAARALNISPSAVSQRVRQLEERLGTVLIRRGQPCTATPAGLRLCRHMEQVDLLEAGLARHLPGLSQPSDPRPSLRVAVNADSLATWFLPALADFTADGAVLVDLSVDDEGHTADWLRDGQVLAAVTASAQPVPGCDMRPLGVLRYRATASPGFMARHFPDGVTAAALARAPALAFNRKDRMQQDWAARHWGVGSLPAHGLPSSTGFVEACLAGMGWGLNPEALVAGHLAAGRLVALSPGVPHDVALVWQVNRMAAAALAPLTRAVRRAAAGALPRDAAPDDLGTTAG